MVAEPAATPVTRPLAFTVAMEVLLLAQVTARPASGLPLESFGVATSCTVWPAATVAVGGVTSTDATARVRAGLELSVQCSQVAIAIVATIVAPARPATPRNSFRSSVMGTPPRGSPPALRHRRVAVVL